MYWFEYKFNNPDYIINSIKFIKDFSTIEFIILFIILLLFIILIYYIVPFLKAYIKFKIKDNEKKKRKKLIQTIAIQKDLDGQIEKELNLK